MFDRKAQIIEKEYNDAIKKIMDSGNYEEIPLARAMKQMKMDANDLGRKMEKLQDEILKFSTLSDIAPTLEESLRYTDLEYQAQMELNRAIYEEALLRGDANAEFEDYLKNLKTAIDRNKKIADSLKGSGIQTKADEIANSGFASGYGKREMAIQTGDFKKYFEGIKETIDASLTSTIGGTEAGTLFGMGGDPVTMLISTLIQTAASIENFGKVLNWASTIAEGMVSMIEGPLNRALKPVVTMLMKLGEAVGALLLPFIEIIGESLGPVASIISVLAEFLKRLFIGLKPIIKIIMYLMNPLNLLMSLLSDFTAAVGAFVSTQADANKELESLYDKELATLQNLYEVGALSGEQYQERLAALKAQYAEPGVDTNSPIYQMVSEMFSFFDDMSASFADMNTALGQLWEALEPIIEPLTTFLVDTIVTLVEILTDVASGIADVITGVSDIVTGILTGNWDMVINGFLTMLKGIFKTLFSPFVDALNWLFRAITDMVNSFIVDKNKKFTPWVITMPFANGTGNVPKDMSAYIHQGEGIVPATFMDSIRKGELALSAPGASGGGNIYVTVYNEGSVITERELNRSIYEGIKDLKKRGYN